MDFQSIFLGELLKSNVILSLRRGGQLLSGGKLIAGKEFIKSN